METRPLVKAVINYLKIIDENQPTAMEYFARDRLDELGVQQRFFFTIEFSRTAVPTIPNEEKVVHAAFENDIELLKSFRVELDKIPVSYDLNDAQKIQYLVMNMFENHIAVTNEWKSFLEAVCKKSVDNVLKEIEVLKANQQDESKALPEGKYIKLLDELEERLEYNRSKQLPEDLKHKIAGAVAYKILLTSNEDKFVEKIGKMDFESYKFFPQYVNDPGNIKESFERKIKRITENFTNPINGKKVTDCISGRDKTKLLGLISSTASSLETSRGNTEFNALGNLGKEAVERHLLAYIEAIEKFEAKDKEEIKLKNIALTAVAGVVEGYLSKQYGNSNNNNQQGFAKELGDAVNRISNRRSNNEADLKPAKPSLTRAASMKQLFGGRGVNKESNNPVSTSAATSTTASVERKPDVEPENLIQPSSKAKKLQRMLSRKDVNKVENKVENNNPVSTSTATSTTASVEKKPDVEIAQQSTQPTPSMNGAKELDESKHKPKSEEDKRAKEKEKYRSLNGEESRSNTTDKKEKVGKKKENVVEEEKKEKKGWRLPGF